jgi:hypothetical protein
VVKELVDLVRLSQKPVRSDLSRIYLFKRARVEECARGDERDEK